MTRTSASRTFMITLAAALLYLAPQVVIAQEDTVEAPTRAEAIKASDAANAKKSAHPAKAEPGAKRDETHTGKDPLVKDQPAANGADAKALTPAQKTAEIQSADGITVFDQSKVIGEAKPWQVYYQEATSPTMKKLEGLHDVILVIITVIVIFVMMLLAYVCLRFRKSANPMPKRFSHNTMVEIIWTVIPIIILVGIAIPSLRLHYQYYNNETKINNPDLTIKVVGHQWYWSYEYPDQGIAFDSNIMPDKDLKQGEPRLLMVDNPLVVPVNKIVRVQMTGADVIHSWALPSFGVKKDAVPGRLNETWFLAEKEGIYFGQCSELCGKGHGFMPIMIYVVSDEQFATWVKGAKLKFAANDSMQFAALN